jgi:MYXO-CTERM domain-containing protein
VLCAALAAPVLAAAQAPAGDVILEPGLYRIHNHPDGSVRPPLYGLRLDELFDVTPDKDLFTFSFDGDGAEMLMELRADSSIHIFGTAFGGLDIGDEYDPDLSGLWEITFTYDTSKPVLGDDDFVVNPPQDPNAGSITPLFGPDAGIPIDLFDYPGEHPFTFRLGDEDDDLGHRGFDGISGWGWLNHGSPDIHVKASDWLFTVDPTPVPAPSAAAALLLALAAGRRRRRAR